MTIEQLSADVLSIIFKLVLCSISTLDILKSAPNFKLAQVNRYFRSVAVDTPQLWDVVSNRHSPEVLRFCIGRKKQCRLRVVLLIDRETDNYVQFFKAVVPLSSSWKEFHFETGRSLAKYLRILVDLPNHCQGLQLPQLCKLTLLYPDPLDFNSIHGEVPDTADYHAYTRNTAEPKLHFYSSWVTPKLRQLRTRNIVPFHTKGAELEECKIKYASNDDPDWNMGPLIHMYPHWVGLRRLTLQGCLDTLYTTQKPSSGSIVLPLLESISLALPAGMGFHRWFLGVLEFPNIIIIDIKFFMNPHYANDGTFKHTASIIRKLLRPQTDYARLERLKFKLSFPNANIFSAIFRKDAAGPNVKIRFAAFDDDVAVNHHPSPLNPSDVKSTVCVTALSDILRRQSGWVGLSALTIFGTEERAERVRSVLPGWTIHHRLQQEVFEAEARYIFADDNVPGYGEGSDVESSGSWETVSAEEEDGEFDV